MLVFSHILSVIIGIQQNLPDVPPATKRELAIGLITATASTLETKPNLKVAAVGVTIDLAVQLLKRFNVAGFTASKPTAS